ncbi:unnamed protein product [Musa acuminata subsp. malaccensis]|uniref:(wild Malaysian banana) hypothetical protein n=1 Tax=Musa acuminata subsp. malaccensis TaxID=214687 RepID=A0A8D7B021_MUSAM|nr:unnamed protein product [Musa acuminata subsp. malaccensis]
MASFTGPNCCLNYSTVDMYLKYELQPTSVRTLVHFYRVTIRSGVITKYDHGSSMANMVAYGQSSPPEYHMPNIPHHLPLLLSYGGGDRLSDVKDVQLLLKDLRNHDADKLVAQLVKEYAHLDFVMGVNAKQVVYDGLIAFFGKHS